MCVLPFYISKDSLSGLIEESTMNWTKMQTWVSKRVKEEHGSLKGMVEMLRNCVEKEEQLEFKVRAFD